MPRTAGVVKVHPPALGTPGEGGGEGAFRRRLRAPRKDTLTPTLSRSTGRGGKRHLSHRAQDSEKDRAANLAILSIPNDLSQIPRAVPSLRSGRQGCKFGTLKSSLEAAGGS